METIDAFYDLLKVAGSGALGFVVGRYKDRKGDVKDAQRQIITCSRELSKDAIEYHSNRQIQERLRCSALLSAKLKQLSTDLSHLSERCSARPQRRTLFVPDYLGVYDAVTRYPFAPEEMPNEPDASRHLEISEACEHLVDAVNAAEARYF